MHPSASYYITNSELESSQQMDAYDLGEYHNTRAATNTDSSVCVKPNTIYCYLSTSQNTASGWCHIVDFTYTSECVAAAILLPPIVGGLFIFQWQMVMHQRHSQNM